MKVNKAALKRLVVRQISADEANTQYEGQGRCLFFFSLLLLLFFQEGTKQTSTKSVQGC